MKNLRSRKLYLQVYDAIKEYIETNHLSPGDKLPTEMEMCEMLGVSRNALREAIKALEITGVVESKPRVGIVIKEFDSEYFFSNIIYNVSNEDEFHQQVKDLRSVLEVGFAKDSFESLTSKEIELLEGYVKKMQKLYDQLIKTNSHVFGIRFAETDASFHKTLFKNIDNKLLKSFISFFWASDLHYRDVTTPESMSLTVLKHEKIYNGLKNQDYDEFLKAMKFHYDIDYGSSD